MKPGSTSGVHLLRNATVFLTVGETTFLVDPLFAPPEQLPPIEDTPNDRRNPLVPLPDMELSYDAVVVTHRHVDHFDERAKEELDSKVPLFCQPEDETEFVHDGFTDVRPVSDNISFRGVTIYRTPGQHGHGDLAKQMGPVSGFVFEADRTIYLAGDTVWYDAVERTISQFTPDMIVLNGGEARFNYGEPITMGIDDIAAVRDIATGTLVVVHMEAINHCLLTREQLRKSVDNVTVPEDGESVTF